MAADIPGLIEGAADGAGLGHAFLRHVERCRLLLHVVDISCAEGRDPIEDIRTINGELARYSETLAALPQMIVANKSDALDAEQVDIAAFEAFVKENGWELLYVSAATGKNLDQLVSAVSKRLAALPPVTVFESELSVDEPIEEVDENEVIVRRVNNDFYVEGKWLVELVESVNFTDYESLAYFEKTLIRRGIIKLLED